MKLLYTPPTIETLDKSKIEISESITNLTVHTGCFCPVIENKELIGIAVETGGEYGFSFVSRQLIDIDQVTYMELSNEKGRVATFDFFNPNSENDVGSLNQVIFEHCVFKDDVQDYNDIVDQICVQNI